MPNPHFHKLAHCRKTYDLYLSPSHTCMASKKEAKKMNRFSCESMQTGPLCERELQIINYIDQRVGGCQERVHGFPRQACLSLHISSDSSNCQCWDLSLYELRVSMRNLQISCVDVLQFTGHQCPCSFLVKKG